VDPATGDPEEEDIVAAQVAVAVTVDQAAIAARADSAAPEARAGTIASRTNRATA